MIARAHYDNLLRQGAAMRLVRQATGDQVSACQRLARVLRTIASYLDGGEARYGTSMTRSGIGRWPPSAARPFAKASGT
jgi:hypothetical protein